MLRKVLSISLLLSKNPSGSVLGILYKIFFLFYCVISFRNEFVVLLNAGLGILSSVVLSKLLL